MKIYDTIFADGESPLKESRNIELYGGMFKWKYPLWYSRDIRMEDCILFEMGRAGIWHTENISMKNSVIGVHKILRRATGIELGRVTMPNAGETLRNCNQVVMKQVTAKTRRGSLWAVRGRKLLKDAKLTVPAGIAECIRQCTIDFGWCIMYTTFNARVSHRH